VSMRKAGVKVRLRGAILVMFLEKRTNQVIEGRVLYKSGFGVVYKRRD